MENEEIILRLLYAICENLKIDYYAPFFGVHYSMNTDGLHIADFSNYSDCAKFCSNFNTLKYWIDLDIQEKSVLADNYQRWYNVISKNFAQLDTDQLTAQLKGIEQTEIPNCTK